MHANFLVRPATTADIPAVADFYARLDHAEQAAWIEILMDGRHPHTRAEHFILAEDRANGKIDSRKIAACSVGMPWTYHYDGTPIGVTRVEQVFAEPAYQGQGLMHAIFDQIHQVSAARGDVMQVVYGRPGFYRHLGYSFALPNEEEGLLITLDPEDPSGPGRPAEAPPEFAICPAEDADLPFITDLYWQGSARYMVSTHMGAAEFHYAKHIYPVESIDAIKNQSGETVGFIRFLGKDVVYALELSPAVSYYQFRRAFLWHLRRTGATQVSLKLGEHHPFYDVLDAYPKKKLLTLHGYARIADIPAFLRAVTPVLDRRLRCSPYAGYTGSPVLCLHNKEESYRLVFENGCLTSVEPVRQEYGDVYLVRDRLVKLFLGRLSLADLDGENAEVYFHNPDLRRLFGILFPRKQSFIYSVN